MAKKLTKKQKAAYPQFILYIDTNSAGLELTGKNYSYRPMKETDLLAAMRKAEEIIQKNGKYIYLVDIYRKTDEETEIGEPYYDVALRTRVHYDYGHVSFSNWHFKDEKHSENSEFSKGLWYDWGDGRGSFEHC